MTAGTLTKYWLPVLLWGGLIFWMSTGMFSSMNTLHFIEPILRSIKPTISRYSLIMINNSIRKAGHVTEYFISGMLIFRAFRAGSNDRRILRWGFYSVVFLVVFAASDEFHQSFVATRTASVLDVCIDTAGGLVAVCISMLRLYRKRT